MYLFLFFKEPPLKVCLHLNIPSLPGVLHVNSKGKLYIVPETVRSRYMGMIELSKLTGNELNDAVQHVVIGLKFSKQLR